MRLQPRASRPGLAGWRDDVLVARVAAPPVDGKANAALCKLLAGAAGVPPSRVSVVRGLTSRDKTVRFAGIDATALHAALGRPAG